MRPLDGAGAPPPATQHYRGEPTDQDVSLAIAFTGSMMVELIEQHDPGPSVYRKHRPHGPRFPITLPSPAQRSTSPRPLPAIGYQAAFTAGMGSAFGDARVTYLDTTTDFPA